VLAGGRGTRMRAWTDRMPKALIPVGGRPFVELQLEWLVANGVTDVVLCIGYRGDMIRRGLGDGGRWDVSLSYVDEGEHLRGTLGALRLALDEGVLGDSFFVLYGDSFLPIDLAEVAEAYRTAGSPGLMTVLRNDGQWDRSNVVYDGGRVVLYDKDPAVRPAEMVHIDYGLSVLSRSVLTRSWTDPRTAASSPASRAQDLADLFHLLSLDGQLAGHEVYRRLYEIGSEEGLAQLEAYLETITTTR
jgi:NDP-sugar pyrophosphorylase family protein